MGRAEWEAGWSMRDDGRVPAADLGTPTVYEAVTRRMVESLTEELREIKTRLNGLLFMISGAILVDLVLRLTG